MQRSPGLVSVIVPARNAAGTLRQQLDAISEQDYPGAWELIVATNGGRDRTAELAKDWSEARGLGTVIDASARKGPAYARNRAAAAGRGDFLAFCDADDVVSRGWLRALVAAAGTADIVTGSHSIDLLNAEAVRSYQSVPFSGQPIHGFLPFASGSNCGIWRHVFNALGGFDERSRTGEDVALSWWAQLSGFRLAVAEQARVHKRFRTNWLSIVPQYFSYGIGDAWLFSQFRSAGMPRRKLQEALAEWREIGRGLPALAGTPARWGTVLLMAALACGRVTGSIRHRALYL